MREWLRVARGVVLQVVRVQIGGQDGCGLLHHLRVQEGGGCLLFFSRVELFGVRFCFERMSYF